MSVVITGGTGFLGQHVEKACLESGIHPRVLGRQDGDLRDPRVARQVLAGADTVVHLAADVGGVAYLAARQGDSFYTNHRIGLNVVQAACFHKCRRLILVGSPCSYAAESRLPLVEKNLHTGFPSGETGAYGLAKLVVSDTANLLGQAAGVEVATLIPGNLYGPGDHFENFRSHVVAALVRRAVLCQLRGEKTFSVWGSGSATRDFVYVENVACAIVRAIQVKTHFTGEFFNVGSGHEISIRQLADILADAVGGGVEPHFIKDAIVGYTHRVMSIERAEQALGYRPETSLSDGLFETIAWVKREGLDQVWLRSEKDQQTDGPFKVFGGYESNRAA
ncbi:MAG: NAD-dependent epimerase/dehydratase family protein [Pirellulales bacterium]|nr:NAD-dependent epimerase/dehydratase family protein [Pirellulales bacterium]